MQYLIVIWPFVLLMGAAALVSLSILRFHRAGAEQARELLSAAGRTITQTAANDLLVEDDIASLPTPVQRWLRASGVMGQPRARTVRLRQRGLMRTTPGGAGMPVKATQYFSIPSPGFVWLADVRMFQVIPIVGRDCLINGRGRMQIALGGLIPVADGIGPAFDQGTALRFLGEIVWFPSAAASPAIRWRAIDEHSAAATLTARDVEVTATFTFDAHGRFIHLAADRAFNGGALERWEIPATAWRTVRGIEIPVRGGAIWKLAAGDFSYYDWEITDVETNRPSLWGEDPSY